MATIEKFEQIISWQEARELNKTVGKLIDSGRFKQSYRLINQVEGSAGSIMDNKRVCSISLYSKSFMRRITVTTL